MASRKTNPSLTFRKSAVSVQHAYVVMFDLEGFSVFFSQPDVQHHVARYLNQVFDAMGIMINGGKTNWRIHGDFIIEPFRKPDHVKFLGDGALYIWTFSSTEEEEVREGFFNFCNHLWDFKNGFSRFLANYSHEFPLVSLPRRIRFGISGGSLYRLQYSEGAESEYIGYCINLAARLQAYCPELGFIASGRLSIPEKDLAHSGYQLVLAKKLKGLPDEYVFVDRNEFSKLDPARKADLFIELPAGTTPRHPVIKPKKPGKKSGGTIVTSSDSAESDSNSPSSPPGIFSWVGKISGKKKD